MYLDHIKKLLKEKQEILKNLLSAHRKNHPFDSIETLSFNKIECSLVRHLPLIEDLSKEKCLYYEKKPLLFSSVLPNLFFILEEKPDKFVVVTAVFQIDSKELKIDKLFWDAGFFISDSIVYSIPEFQRDFSSYFESSSLSPEANTRLLEKLEDDNVLWEWKKAIALVKTPILRLFDPRGFFSKVCIEYHGYGEFLVGEGEKNPIRDYFFEDSLVEDLIELGFVNKLGGMYLPLDKLEGVLRFLLEIGWKVLDFEKREVLIGQKIALKMELSEIGQIEVRSYVDGEELPASCLAASLAREEIFSPLTSNTVMLIDQGLKKEITPLLKAGSLKGNVLVLAKEQLGYADISSNKKYVQKGDKLAQLLEKKNFKHDLDENFKGTLLPYQEIGLSWLLFLYNNGFSGVLADEMGLGKTVQVIAFLSVINNKRPHVIVAPAFLLYNWKSEIKRFLPGREIYTHHGRERLVDSTLLQSQDIILTSYQTLRQDESLFQKGLFESLILDEAMAIKNAKSLVAKSILSLKASFRLCITATPLENKIEELFSLFLFLMPSLEKRWKKNLELLSKEISPYLLRRLKKDVEIDLPEKIVQDVWVEMNEEQECVYEEFLKGKKDHLEEKNALEMLTIIMRLRQIASHPYLIDSQKSDSFTSSAKLVYLFTELEELLLQKHKILIFSQFTSLLQIVKKELEKRGYTYHYLDGKVSISERQKRIEKFQTAPENALFLISLKAGGVGLNLTEADYVYILDPWWNEKIEDQAIDRAHRIGQKKTVIAKRLYTKNSIEEKLFLLKQEKSSLFDRVIENSSSTLLKKEDLRLLLD